MKKILDKIDSIATRPLKPLAGYWILLAIATLFALPIIMANTDYIDDNARRVGGYYEWGSLGRFATEALMHVLTFSGRTMADPGIQMQLLSIPVLAFAGWIFVRALAGKNQLNFAQIVTGALLVVNPYLLTNLSFRYDSLSMILGYTLAVVAAVIVAVKVSQYRIAASIGLLFLAAALYQPMILMFLVVAVVLLVYRYAVSQASILRGMLWVGLVFVVAVVLYYGTLKLLQFSNVGGDSRGILVPFSREGLMVAAANFVAGIKTVGLFFANGAGRVIGAAFAAILMLTLIWLVVRKYRTAKWYDSLLVIGSPALIVISIMGPFVLMSSALTYQVRTLSTGIGIALLAGVLVLALQRLRVRGASLLLAVPVLFIFYSLNFSHVYGGALKYQRDYDKVVYDEIDDSITSIGAIQRGSMVHVGGVASSPLSVQELYEKRPLLKRMDIAGDNTAWFIRHSLNNMHATKLTNWFIYSKEQQEARWAVCRQPEKGLIEANTYFSIYRSVSGEHYVWLTDPSVGVNTFC